MESVGSIIMYVIIALSIVLFSVLTVATRKILRSSCLHFSLPQPSISSSTMSSSGQCR